MNGKWRAQVNAMEQERIKALISIGEQIVTSLKLSEFQEKAVEVAADTEAEACLLWVVVLAGIIGYLSNQYGITRARDIAEEATGAVIVFSNRPDKAKCN